MGNCIRCGARITVRAGGREVLCRSHWADMMMQRDGEEEPDTADVSMAESQELDWRKRNG